MTHLERGPLFIWYVVLVIIAGIGPALGAAPAASDSASDGYYPTTLVHDGLGADPATTAPQAATHSAENGIVLGQIQPITPPAAGARRPTAASSQTSSGDITPRWFFMERPRFGLRVIYRFEQEERGGPNTIRRKRP